MKTAKSVEVAKLAAPDFGPITVSTLAEARYFAAAGWRDQIYAVGITPAKLDAVAALNAAGAAVKIITDDVEVARAIAAHPGAIQALVEVDVGEARGGVAPDGGALPEIAAALGPRLAGVLSHSGHSYAGRSPAEMAAIAEAERLAITAAAARLREARPAVPIVSLGSSPTACMRRGWTASPRCGPGSTCSATCSRARSPPIRWTTSPSPSWPRVIGRRPDRNTLLLDAGALALSKDRSTQAAPRDWGFGRVLDLAGQPLPGEPMVARAYQEHGEVHGDAPLPFDRPADRRPAAGGAEPFLPDRRGA